MRNFLMIMLVLAASGKHLFAQRTAYGSLHVTAQIEGSISIEFTTDSNREPILASGSSSVSFSVPTFAGSFSRGSLPVGAGETSFLISSPFAIRVVKANLLSGGYSLRASLNIPDAARTWTIDGIDIGRLPERVIAPSEFY